MVVVVIERETAVVVCADDLVARTTGRVVVIVVAGRVVAVLGRVVGVQRVDNDHIRFLLAAAAAQLGRCDETRCRRRRRLHTVIMPIVTGVMVGHQGCGGGRHGPRQCADAAAVNLAFLGATACLHER